MTYRAIQWATGAMGRTTLRTMIDTPDVDVVGVLVYSPDKVGRDAGELARRAPIGVAATDDVEAILALDADVVIHVPQLRPYGGHDDEIVRILESGKNVIVLNGFSSPARWAPERRARIEAACAAGNSTLVGGGLNPGFIGEQLATVVSGMCSRVEHIHIVESVDCREIRNPAYFYDGLAFGADPSAVDPNDPNFGPAVALNGMYEEVIATIAERLGVALDDVATEHELLPATTDLELPVGAVPKGRVSHTRWCWHGIADGARWITLTINWYVEAAYLDEESPALWAVSIKGQPCADVAVKLTKHPEDMSRAGADQYAVGGTVVNLIPLVVDAPAGIMTRPMATPARVVRPA